MGKHGDGSLTVWSNHRAICQPRLGVGKSQVTLGVDLGRDEGTHGKRTGETHQCRGTH